MSAVQDSHQNLIIILMKTVRLKNDGASKESMSFPAFDYFDIADNEWEESKFYDDIEKKFLFVVFQMNDDKNDEHKRARFRGAFFWTMGLNDRGEVKKVYEATRDKIRSGDYDHFPKSSENPVSHVRPHGRDGDDKIEGPDGKMHIRRSFWLNARYITKVVDEKLRKDRDFRCLAHLFSTLRRTPRATGRCHQRAGFSPL